MESTDHNSPGLPGEANTVPATSRTNVGAGLIEPPADTDLNTLLGRIDALCGTESLAPSAKRPELQFKAPRPVLGFRCPQCNKRTLRRSRRTTFGEYMSWFVLFAPYRCRYCRYHEMRFVLDK